MLWHLIVSFIFIVLPSSVIVSQLVMMVATLVASCLGGRGHSGRIVHTNHRHPGGHDCSHKHQNTHK